MRSPPGGHLRSGVEADAFRSVHVLVPEERVLPATEGVVGHRHRYRHVDADHPDVDTALEAPSSLAAVGEDGGPVAVWVRVDELDGLVDRVGPYDGEHRAEDLLGVDIHLGGHAVDDSGACLLYTSPSPRDGLLSRMPSSA